MKDDLPGATKEEVARHVPGLDGIRGLAILLVMFSHFIVVGGHLHESQPFDRLLLSGFLGVDFFFVLSGFLITGILVEAKKKSHYFRTFYIRRALRIFPLYYSLLAVAFFTVPLLSPQDAPRLTGSDSPWWYWLYASNIGMAFKGDWLNSPTWIDLGHFWSLAVEEQFYMVWPLVVFCLKPKWLYRLCIVLVVSSPFLSQWLRGEIGELATYVSTLGRTGSLAAGAFLSLVWRDPAQRARAERLAVPVAWVSGILLLLSRLLPWIQGVADLPTANMALAQVNNTIKGFEATYALVFGTACVAIACRSIGPNLLQRFFESSVLRWLGKYSYGIYVYHHALKTVWVYFIWDRLAVPLVGPGWAGTLLYFVVATVASLSLAWLSWHFFEARILALKRHFTYDQKPA